MVVSAVNGEGGGQLADVALAFDSLRVHLGVGQGGKQHRGQNGNDGDDHQQLNEREAQAQDITPKQRSVANFYHAHFRIS